MKAIAWTLLLFSSLALAQGPDGKDAKPSDGAIKGGSLPAPEKRAERRCEELSGTLRDQCLEHKRKAPAGATRGPGEPPPQNPRQEKP
jgi:hypothetical protein